MNAEDIVVMVISLSGGELVGRTRLQKEVYLLDRCGANLGLSFTYHHYGPYSFDLTDGWIDAEANNLIDVEERFGRYDVAYSVFRSKSAATKDVPLGDLSVDSCVKLLEKMRSASDVTLELAATMVYLRERGTHANDVIPELTTRKPLKATTGRVSKAQALLEQLGLEA